MDNLKTSGFSYQHPLHLQTSVMEGFADGTTPFLRLISNRHFSKCVAPLIPAPNTHSAMLCYRSSSQCVILLSPSSFFICCFEDVLRHGSEAFAFFWKSYRFFSTTTTCASDPRPCHTLAFHNQTSNSVHCRLKATCVLCTADNW